MTDLSNIGLGIILLVGGFVALKVLVKILKK